MLCRMVSCLWAVLVLALGTAASAQVRMPDTGRHDIVRWHAGVSSSELGGAAVVQIPYGVRASDLTLLRADQTIETPSGARMRYGRYLALRDAFARAHLRVAQHRSGAYAILPAPKMRGKPLRPRETSAEILARPSTDIILLPSGGSVTVAQLRQMAPYVEQRYHVDLSGNKPPQRVGAAVAVHQVSDLKLLSKQAPDDTVLVSPHGTRITLGALRTVLKKQFAPVQKAVPYQAVVHPSAGLQHGLGLGAPGVQLFSNSSDTIAWVASVMDLFPAGALPFTGNDLRNDAGIIAACEDSGGADDVVGCIDQASKAYAMQGGDVPSWFPKMLEVYLDIRHKDYWGLLEDTSEAVACAVAQVLTGGVDLCGAIQALIDAAESFVHDAQAVAQFFADLGAGVAGVAKDAYCYVFGCDDSAPPPAPEVVAYANFYFPRVPAGVEQRLTSFQAWLNYADGSDSTIVGEGENAGYSHGALMKALPVFGKAVYANWDTTIATKVAPDARNTASQWASPATVSATVAQTESTWDDSKLSAALQSLYFEPEESGCYKAVRAVGAESVDQWVAEGRAVGPFSGFKWPDHYTGLCLAYNQQFAAHFKPYVISRALLRTIKYCKGTACADSLSALACTAVSKDQGKNETCTAPDPSAVSPKTMTATFDCNGKIVQLTIPIGQGPPPGCKAADNLQNPQPTPSPVPAQPVPLPKPY